MTSQERGAPPPAPEPPPPVDVADWSYATRRLAMVLILLILAGIAWLSRAVIPVLVVAGIVALLVAPVIRRLERRGLRHGAAVLAVYLALFVLGGALMLLVVPPLIHEIERAVLAVARFLETGQAQSEAILGRFRQLELGRFTVDLSPVVDRALAAIRSAELPADVTALERLVGPVRQALTAASNLFLGAVGLFVKSLLSLAISLYMSLEAPALLASFESFMDREQSAESRELLRRVGEAWTDFLRGQFVLMVIIGVVVALGGLVLGLPGALALGLLAGVLEVLPNIGPILATIPAVAIALVAGSQVLPVSNGVFALIVVAFYAGVQLLENNLVVPRVIGKAVALPSVVIMVAVIVGAQVGGVLGAFVAAPAAATLREVLAYMVDKTRGLDPYPELRAHAARAEAPAESE
jgi:predicted PurR-regulated permease PerM